MYHDLDGIKLLGGRTSHWWGLRRCLPWRVCCDISEGLSAKSEQTTYICIQVGGGWPDREERPNLPCTLLRPHSTSRRVQSRPISHRASSPAAPSPPCWGYGRLKSGRKCGRWVSWACLGIGDYFLLWPRSLAAAAYSHTLMIIWSAVYLIYDMAIQQARLPASVISPFSPNFLVGSITASASLGVVEPLNYPT